MRRFIEFFVFLLTALLLSFPALAQQDIMTTVIGGGPSDIPALDANLNQPDAVAVDSAGNVYISAYAQNRVFKVDTKGILTVFAGQGVAGYAGDGVKGGATQAFLNGPQGLAVDSAGNVYIVDEQNQVIRKVDTTNTITTIAGVAGHAGYNGDGKPATSFWLYYPIGVAVDAAGTNLYIADNYNCRVRKVVLASDTISTFAGNGTCGFSGDNGPATAAEVYHPNGVAVDSTGNVFIADTANYVIREVTKSNGKINTIAGTPDSSGFSGDGGLATKAQISVVIQLSVNSAGKLVTFPDQNNQRIRQFTVGGDINTVAGNGTACSGICGDGGPATEAEFYYPQGIAVTSTGTIYIADLDNNRVRDFTVGGNINGFAGNGSTTVPTLLNGIPPTGVEPNQPFGVYEDPSKNIFFADTANQMVRELVNSSDLVDFFAGDGVAGYAGDGGPAVQAKLYSPHAVARDSSGNIYIADYNNCLVRMVNTAKTPVISTFAGLVVSGSPRCGFDGDGGPATNAELYNPTSVFVDSNNNVYIADYNNQRIREVTKGTINTIAGIGTAGYSGDGGLAVDAELYYPSGVAVDPAGNVFIADTYNHRIREISALSGLINTVAGNGGAGFTGDGPATQEELYYPYGVAVDANDNLFIADTYNHIVRWVSAAGQMTTFGGVPRTAGFNGDGGPATSAELYYPTGIFADSSGNYLVADQSNDRIRGVSAFAALNLSSGNLSFPLTSVGSTSNPQSVTLTALGPLNFTNIQISGDFSESDDCPSSLPNGQTCTMYVYFSPTAAGTRIGAVTINDNGFFNAVSTINLTGIGTAITLSGVPVNFGSQLVNTTSGTKTVTVTNNGTTGITMGAITLNETKDFAIQSNNCPASGKTLAAGASCKIGLTFTPKSTGAKKGAVIINDSDPTSPQIAGVSGTGTSNVVLSPNSVNFGTEPVGVASGVTTITLINNTGNTLTLGNPALTISADFVINKAKTTCTNSLKIANGGNCAIGVQFKPTAIGYRSGTLSVSDSDSTSPQTAALTGIGISIGFTPTSVNFGTVTEGQCSSNAPVTVANSGPATVTFTGVDIVGTNSPDFSWGNSTCSIPSGTLAPGASCNIYVRFCPTTKGTEKATYELFDNSLGSPQKLPMTGKGQ
jgi:sugar lactone lactonase YvrE